MNCPRTQIKERTAALDETRNLIGPTASSAILDRVARSGWVELLQAISNLIIVERNAYDASAPNKRAPSEKRMLDGAGLLKSIVERTCACFPRKAVKVLFKHCFTIIIFQQDQVFRPITLDTLRTLNAALSVRQHLEHLEDAQWLDLVRLASGVALGTPVRLDSKNGMDDELYLSQSDSEDEGRHRPKSKGKVKEPSEGPHAQDLIESFTLLAHLMHSPNANLILLPQASALLQRFSRLFQLVMPVHQNLIVETTSHLPLLQAFNGLLSQLVDNASMPLTKHAPLIWLQLTRLWSGIKTAAVKEQTLISFKRLTPVILSLPDDAMRQQCCRALFGNLSDEPSSRFRIEELALDALQLRPSRPLNPASSLFPDIFELPTFCWAPTQSFGPGQAASWSLLDSTSDCLFVLFQMSEKAGATQTRTSTDSPGPSKRRKVCSSNLLHDLFSPNCAILCSARRSNL